MQFLTLPQQYTRAAVDYILMLSAVADLLQTLPLHKLGLQLKPLIFDQLKIRSRIMLIMSRVYLIPARVPHWTRHILALGRPERKVLGYWRGVAGQMTQ